MKAKLAVLDWIGKPVIIVGVKPDGVAAGGLMKSGWWWMKKMMEEEDESEKVRRRVWER